MSPVLTALLPVFALIAIGFVMRRYLPFGDGFWLPAERLNYRLLFPALLVASLARSELAEVEWRPMALAMVGAVLAVAAGLYALRRFTPVDGPAFAALLQGSIRPNAYVALAGAAGFYDSAGLTLAAVGIAVVLPVVNVLSVAVLSAHGAPAGARVRDAVAQIVRNPIILACALGIAINLVGLGLPGVVEEFLELLGRAALPLGLMCVGASLDFSNARVLGRPLVVSAALKLAVLPGLTAVFCLLLGVQGATAAVAVLFNACPASASSYILTRQLGGDHRLMAGIITAQTLAATIALPLWMAVSW